MTTPAPGNFAKEMTLSYADFKYDLYKSPIGYVITAEQFDKFLHWSNNRLKEERELVVELTQEAKTGVIEANETNNYIHSRYTKIIKDLNFEIIAAKIVATIAVIIVIALAIILLVVLV